MQSMEERRNKIVEIVNQEGSVGLKKLKKAFSNVSEMTLRRDLEYLDQQKKIIRVHGGAKSVEVLIGTDDLFMRRSTRNLEAKKIIAQKAVDLLNQNTSIFLDSGTTTTELARIFPDDSFLIHTNSVSCVFELAKLRKAQVNMIGGRLNPFSLCLDGVRSMVDLSDINFQIAFLGVTGYIGSWGFTCGSEDEAELKKMVVRRSEKVVLLMDHHKVGVSSTYTFVRPEEVDVIISDSGLDEKSKKEFERKNIIVL